MRRRRRHALSAKYGSMHKVPRNTEHARFFVTIRSRSKKYLTPLLSSALLCHKSFITYTRTPNSLYFFIFRPCDSEPPLLLSMRIPLDFNSGVGRKGETVCGVLCAEFVHTTKKKEKNFGQWRRIRSETFYFPSASLTYGRPAASSNTTVERE